MTSPSGYDPASWSKTPRPWASDDLSEQEQQAALRLALDNARVKHLLRTPQAEEVPDAALAFASYAYFLSLLRSPTGEPLTVPWHIEEWAEAFQDHRLCTLLAARDHGKTVTAWGYILWRCWKHNRNPDGTLKPGNPDGTFSFTYFTSIKPLSIERFAAIEGMILDNTHLFGDLLPVRVQGEALASVKPVWAKTQFRLMNGAEGTPRSVGSSTRGLHPQLIVADDIVTDKNSGTALQRGRVWNFLVGTVIPMAGTQGQVLFLGTPQHKEDALFKIKGKPGWHWMAYPAVDWETKAVLWPERYDYNYLVGVRETDPLIFSREYQMDPRDDASSIFPYALLDRQLVPLRFVRPFPLVLRQPGDVVIAGWDLAISETVGADYTVLMVIAYNRHTQKRRLLWACRERGLTFDQQIALAESVAREFMAQIIVVEENNFQRWLRQALAKRPIVSGIVFGHTTGMEKQSLAEGVPAMKVVLEHDLWEVPSGLDADGRVVDPEAKAFQDVWRTELNAFGWADGKLQGVGEHDDCVMGTWFVERGVRMADLYAAPDEPQVFETEDLGIERVSIGSPY